MSNPAFAIPLPKSWPTKVRSAMLHVVSLAKYAAVYTRSWAADCPKARVRFRAERDQHREDNALLREKLRIKDARMASIPAHQRPFYRPPERLAILELKAARGWSLEQTAKRFFVCPKTVASWMKRLDEEGAAALVQLPVPVNKFPEFVRYAVQRLQTLCPNLGKKKLSEVLARAGLHLGTTTIGRIRRESWGSGARGRPSHGPNAGLGVGGWQSFWITIPAASWGSRSSEKRRHRWKCAPVSAGPSAPPGRHRDTWSATRAASSFPRPGTKTGVAIVASARVSVPWGNMAVLPFWNEPCAQSRKRRTGPWFPRGVKPCAQNWSSCSTGTIRTTITPASVQLGTTNPNGSASAKKQVNSSS